MVAEVASFVAVFRARVCEPTPHTVSKRTQRRWARHRATAATWILAQFPARPLAYCVIVDVVWGAEPTQQQVVSGACVVVDPNTLYVRLACCLRGGQLGDDPVLVYLVEAFCVLGCEAESVAEFGPRF